MVALVNGSQTKIMQNKNGYGRWLMWTILAVGDAIATTRRVME